MKKNIGGAAAVVTGAHGWAFAAPEMATPEEQYKDIMLQLAAVLGHAARAGNEEIIALFGEHCAALIQESLIILAEATPTNLSTLSTNEAP